jgi:hypothetical protein
MANLNANLTVVVVHKGPRKNSKIELTIFNDTRVDDIIDSNKRKPPIPHDHELLEIGVGSAFEKRYKEKYKL